MHCPSLPFSSVYNTNNAIVVPVQSGVEFRGRRDHTKEDVHMLIYKDEMKVAIIIIHTHTPVLAMLHVHCCKNCTSQNWAKFYESQSHRTEKKGGTLKGSAKRVGMKMMELFLD